MTEIEMEKDIPDLHIYPYSRMRIDRARGIRKWLLRWLPLHVLSALKFELQLAWVHRCSRDTPRRFHNCRDMLVNIGAGDTGREGWINIDVIARNNVNCVIDSRRGLPFADNSVRGIFCEHFLEHLDYTEEVPGFLSECCRVLVEGGVMRIVVPDAERYLLAYARGGWEELSRIRPLGEEHTDHHFQCRYNTRMELINVVFRQGGEHKSAYDFETLAFLLRRYGFQRVQRQAFGRSVMPDICIDQASRVSESLYVEGIK